jgi:diguanylate cyclase (GGDEF)-like protein
VRWLLAIVLFGGAAVVLGHDWLGIGGAGFDDIAGGELYDAVVVAAAIACLLRARAVPRERAAWLLFGAAVVCWAAGEIYWTAFILDAVEPPYPSGADALYLAFYPLACAGLVLLVRARAHELDWRRWSDATIAALGTASLGAAFVFDYVAARTTGADMEVATSLAYPLGDIVLLALIVGVIALTDWRPGRTWILLLLGLSFTVVADVAYSIQGVGGVVPAGSWIDPIYMLSAAALGAVLWTPVVAPIRTSGRGGRRRELMVPGLLAVVMVGLFAMQVLSARGGLAAILWGATMVAVVVRLAISVRENQRLVEQVRTDSLTGIGNRGAMQLDLDALCAEASTRRPVVLYLFDLNGFKRYNDTFGHPAGDKLLTRLAARLRDAVGEDGSVYRIGGDEFCALLSSDPEHFDAVAKRAAQALTESDRGVDVSSSWGGATIPPEAGDPAEALQLADVRMYAQKESRRTAHAGSAAPAPTLQPETVKVSEWPHSTSEVK